MSFLKNFDFITVVSSPEAINPALEWLQEQSQFFYIKEYDINAEYFTWTFICFVLVALIDELIQFKNTARDSKNDGISKDKLPYIDTKQILYSVIVKNNCCKANTINNDNK